MPLTDAGLTVPTYEEIRAEIIADFRASPDLNPDGAVNLEEDSLLGVTATISAEREAAVYELLKAVYAQGFKAGAEGAQLEGLAELLGQTRTPASASTVTLTGTGTNGTVIAAGSRVGDSNRLDVDWITLDEVTIASGVFSVEAQASITGPVAANAGTLEEIRTPVVGWDTVTNAADADLGANEQSDASLRNDMTNAVGSPGSGTVAAVFAAVSDVPGVTSCRVFENATTETNSSGVPRQNIEVVVEGGDDVELAQAIYDSKANGGGTYSATSDGEWAEDANGQDVWIAFSRPVPVSVYVYVEVEATATTTTQQDAVKAAVKAAVVLYGDDLGPGDELIRSKFNAPVFGVAGITNVARIGISIVNDAGALAGAALSGTAGDIELTFRQRPVFDTVRVTVVLV